MTALSMRLTSLVVAAGLMASCGVIHRGKKVTPTVGERISVLTGETDIQAIMNRVDSVAATVAERVTLTACSE